MFVVQRLGYTTAYYAFFVSLLLLLFPFFSYAQIAGGIGIIPASIEEAVDPGSRFEDTIKITNESEEDTEFYIYTRDIKGVENGGVPIFAEENSERTGFEITEWIALDAERIFVEAGQTVEYPLVINVPENASPGSHFGGVFVSREPPRLREIGAGVGYEVASVISLRINGDVLDDARIRSFFTDKLFYSTKNVNFVARIENQGNIMIRPRGPLEIKSSFSSDPVAQLLVNDSLAGVFPGTTRDIEFSWNDEGLGFGKYTAELALVYDGELGNKTIDASLVFWVFPTKIMLTILGVFVGIFVLGYLFTKYYVQRAIMRAAGGRRIAPQRYRRQSSISRFAFVFISVLTVFVIFLIIVLIFMA